MKRLLSCLAAALVLAVTLAGGARAATAGETAGRSADIISSLTMPGYTPSTVCESELGRLAADAMRAGTGCGIALLGGGELDGGLRKGALTQPDIFSVLPGNEPVYMLGLTPALLWEVMEHAVSRSVLGEDERIDPERSAFDGFPQISGFQVEYDASRPAGERVRWIRLADGTELARDDDVTRLTAAVSGGLLDPELGYEMLRAEDAAAVASGTAELLLQYAAGAERLEADPIRRVRAVGTADNTLVGELRILPLLPYALIAVLLVTVPLNRHRLRNMDGTFSKRYRDYGDGAYD